MVKFTYVTGNKDKIESAKQIYNPLGIEVDFIKLDIPEVQADTNKEVAIASSMMAYSAVKNTVMKNDSGLVIPALKGFPGTYTSYVEETLGEDGILKLMQGLEGDDRKAYFVECLALCEGDGEDDVHVFTCKTSGRIAEEKCGEFGYGYDKIFIPDNAEGKTLACFDDHERYSFWDNSGYLELAKYLKEKYEK